MHSTLAGSQDQAFERLYSRYGLDVYRFALALLRNPADAEDVTQTTFLNAYRALESGERPRLPQTWLFEIAHNAARSRVRRAMRRPREVPLDAAADAVVEEAERPSIPELVHALERLPRNQRVAVTMRELEGRSYPEIAQTLGVTVPAVEGLLARARRTLRAQAAAIRGLVVLALPRSLRNAFDTGGAALVGKSAGLVIAAAVVGGAGFVAVGPSRQARAPIQPRVPAKVQAPVPAPEQFHGAEIRTVNPVRTAPPAARSPTAPRTEPTAATPASAAVQEAAPSAPAASPAAAAPLQQPVSLPAGPADSAIATVTTVSAAVTTVAAAVPAVPAVPTLPVEPPPLPPPPPVPSPPAPLPLP